MSCAGCGAGHGPLVPSTACAERAMVVAEREFSDPGYFAVHRVTVAAYTLQHPDSSTPHAVAVHRAALEGAVGRGLQGAKLAAHVRWASAELRRQPPASLVPPRDRGTLTIADVVAAPDAAAHCAVVREWAAQVWAAWSPAAQVDRP